MIVVLYATVDVVIVFIVIILYGFFYAYSTGSFKLRWEKLGLDCTTFDIVDWVCYFKFVAWRLCLIVVILHSHYFFVMALFMSFILYKEMAQ